MARKRRGGNFSRYMKGNIQMTDNFPALAAKDLASGITNSVSDTTRVSSVEAVYGIQGLAPTEGAGPWLVGVAHSDYSDTEIEEYIENAGAWEIGNMVQREVTQRRVRIVGQINTPGAVGETAGLNDGKPIKTKLGWLLQEDQSLRFWIYNMGDAAGPSTPTYQVFGHANLCAI